jgi:alpha-glucosidase
VLGGEIGEHVTVARQARHSKNWFIGSITNDKARQVEMKLDFLAANTTYVATIYKDGKDADYAKNPGSYEIVKQEVSAGDTISVRLAPGGGVAISLLAR